LSSKQRRGYGHSATWRQTTATKEARRREGFQPKWEELREARERLDSRVFAPVELHAKAYELIEQGGYVGNFQTQAAASASELLKAWYDLQELPKQTRKPWGIIEELVFKYVTALELFIKNEPEAAAAFFPAVADKWLVERVRDDSEKVGSLSADAGRIKHWWNSFYRQTRLKTADEKYEHWQETTHDLYEMLRQVNANKNGQS
jgi:hypothetical protein